MRGIGVRLDSISGLLDQVTPPDSEAMAYRKLVLGASLFSQACERTRKYLETNDDSIKEDAAILLADAKEQLGKQ